MKIILTRRRKCCIIVKYDNIQEDFKMKFTRIAAFVMAAAMATSLVACNNTTAPSDTSLTIKGLDANGFFEGVKASEIVTSLEYKGIELPKSVKEASEEDIEEQIDIILEEYVTYEQIKEGTIEDGTTVNIDYVGSVDGVPFEGGSTGGQGTDVTIGVTNYIDGFLDQLIGHKPGETFDINVTFPDPYPNNTDLSGKPAVFNITVNYIQGDKIEAELTDEIAAEYGFDTKEDLIADISAWLIASQASEAFNTVAEKAVCENIPDSVIEYFKARDKAEYTNYAKSYGMTLEDFLKNVGGYDSLDAYYEEQMENYITEAKFYLVAQAIAELENIVITSEDVTASAYAGYVEDYGEAYIKQVILIQDVIPVFIVDNATLVDNVDEAETTEAE